VFAKLAEQHRGDEIEPQSGIACSVTQLNTWSLIAGGRMKAFEPKENDVSDFFSIRSSRDGSQWRNKLPIALRTISASSISAEPGT
jgi:hypothetical protein